MQETFTWELLDWAFTFPFGRNWICPQNKSLWASSRDKDGGRYQGDLQVGLHIQGTRTRNWRQSVKTHGGQQLRQRYGYLWAVQWKCLERTFQIHIDRNLYSCVSDSRQKNSFGSRPWPFAKRRYACRLNRSVEITTTKAKGQPYTYIASACKPALVRFGTREGKVVERCELAKIPQQLASLPDSLSRLQQTGRTDSVAEHNKRVLLAIPTKSSKDSKHDVLRAKETFNVNAIRSMNVHLHDIHVQIWNKGNRTRYWIFTGAANGGFQPILLVSLLVCSLAVSSGQYSSLLILSSLCYRM